MTTAAALHLDPARRRALKARAHHLRPVVIIGDAGLTPAVLREIDRALSSHELIKVRVPGDDRAARLALIASVCAALQAAPVQNIGKILVIFRPRPADAAPKAAPSAAKTARRGPRRTKRSFQMA
jgi:putative YhbY family RNA-binding protein